MLHGLMMYVGKKMERVYRLNPCNYNLNIWKESLKAKFSYYNDTEKLYWSIKNKKIVKIEKLALNKKIENILIGTSKYLGEIDFSFYIWTKFSVFREVSSQEVSKIILKFNNETCTLDCIPTKIIKLICPIILPFLTTLIKTSLNTGIFPKKI